MQNLEVVANNDMAVSHGFHHVFGRTTAGQTFDMWWRATIGFHKVEGSWLIVHEHSSVPLDVDTGLASLDLVPDDNPDR